MTFRELYTKEMDEISLSEGFETRTANLLKQKAKRKDETLLPKRKTIKVFAAVFAIIALFSLTVFAISYLLSAGEVAKYLGDKEIAGMFKDSECEPQTVSNGTYDVIFLGKTTGTLLNKTEGFECEEARTYAVIAIRSTDGTPLSLMNGTPVSTAPVIEGCMPFETWAILNMGARGLEREGILYYLFDYQSLEVFADRTVSIAVFEGNAFPTPDILTLDENGKVIYGEGYVGIKGIFDLLMDKTKADPEAAEALLGNY